MTMTETTPWTLTIPAYRVEGLVDKLAKLTRRADKLGMAAPEVAFGESRVVKGTEGGLYEVVDVTVTADAPVKLAGWEFCGVIEHGADDKGQPTNLMRMAPSYTGTVPRSYRTDAATCDHCRTVRNRRETFVVAQEGELRRVGRSCLVDYMGADSAKQLVAQAGFIAALAAALNDSLEDGYGSRGPSAWSLAGFLSLTAHVVRELGWTSRGAVYRGDAYGPATADHVLRELTRKQSPTDLETKRTAADRELGAKALAWARAIDPDTDSDYLHNVRVIANRGYAREKDAGLAASIVSAWQREAVKLAAAARAAERGESEWLGEVGQRFGGKGKTAIPGIQAEVMRRSSFEGMYGTTTIILAQADCGAELLWFSSADVSSDVQPGVKVDVVGTIKRHTTDKRSGAKQTQLSRAKLTVRA